MKIIKSKLSTILISTLLLTLVLYLDWSLLKGGLTFFLPSSFFYVVIFLIGYIGYPTLVEVLRDIKGNIINIRKKYKVISIVLLLGILIAFIVKNTLNEFILNQNILSLSDYALNVIIHIKHVIKTLAISSLLLFSTTIYLWSKKYYVDIKKIINNKQTKKVFWLIFFFFIFIRLFFLLYYKGNFQDDWSHISAGMNFFDTWELNKINQYFNGNGYLRGSYVSIMVGAYFKFIGRSVDIAQLVPFTIGLVNFFLLAKILYITIKDRSIIMLSLLLYSIIPHVITNHLYIRMYVFYEMFLLIGLLWILRIVHSIKQKQNLKALLNLISLFIINYLFYDFSKDRGALFISLILGACIAYIYIFEVGKHLIIRVKTNWLNFLLNIKPKLKIYITSGVILFTLFYFLIFTEYLSYNTNSATLIFTFKDLILQDYWIYIALGMISIPALYKIKEINIRIILATSLATIIVISVLPDYLNLVRGLNMLFPIIIIFAAIGIQNIITIASNKKQLPVWIGLLLIITTIRAYPGYFIIQGPRIPGEIAYYEFEQTFNYIHDELENKRHVYSAFNMIPNMYWGTENEYILNIGNIVEDRYFPENVIKINSLDELKILENNNEVCITLKGFSEDLLLNEETKKHIKENYTKEYEALGFKILCSNQI